MKSYTFVFIILLLLLIIPDIYFYFKLKSNNAKPIYIFLHLAGIVFFIAIFSYIKFRLDNAQNFRVVVWIMWFYFYFLLIYIPKLIHIFFYFINYLFKKIFKRRTAFFKYLRIAISAFVVIIMLVGAYITPRNFELTKVTVKIPNLPDSFNGYKIIQISDIHLGSWNNRYKKFNGVIKLINRQNADIIVFTGDLVNNYAEETDGWSPFFLQLEAKNAKFAIKGNHDYGDYTDWDTFDKRKNNNLRINQSFENFKFKLLLNEHVYLKKGTDSICLVGVENFGGKRTSNYSDLAKALQNTNPNDIKILLSHDPNHFDAEISKHKDIVLTLAGHTHAAQLGIKIGDWLFSPAAFVFKYSAGLYKSENQYIYVNRGLGYIGLPLQIGVRPEITLIELIK